MAHLRMLCLSEPGRRLNFVFYDYFINLLARKIESLLMLSPHQNFDEERIKNSNNKSLVRFATSLRPKRQRPENVNEFDRLEPKFYDGIW